MLRSLRQTMRRGFISSVLGLSLRLDGTQALLCAPRSSNGAVAFSSRALKTKKPSTSILFANKGSSPDTNFDVSAERVVNKDEDKVVSRGDAVLSAIPSFLSSTAVSRDALWKVPVGVVFAFGYGKLVSQVVGNTIRGTVYPEEHESRVRSTIQDALMAAAMATSSSSNTLRVLEVGIGKEARVLRRGLYEPALRQLARSSSTGNVQLLAVTGLDIQLPDRILQQKVKEEQRQQNTQSGRIPLNVDFVESSVESIPFEDGYFDAIVCCLTLCSVEEPQRAIQEMRRVLNPNGGALGYVEHVAADGGFLEWQQKILDPVQQAVADNCHLHRATQDLVSAGMGVGSNTAKVVIQERFLVDGMWPVSMQSCGVVQRI